MTGLRLTLTNEQGEVVEMWTTDEEDDLGVFDALRRELCPAGGPPAKFCGPAAVALEDELNWSVPGTNEG